MHWGPKGWQACNERWKEPLDEALKDGTLNLRLQHNWQTSRGNWNLTWYEIDFTDIDNMKQKNEDSGKERRLAVFRQKRLVESATAVA